MRTRIVAGALCITVLLGGCATATSPAENPSVEASSGSASLTFAFTGAFADLQIAEFERVLSEAAGESIELSINGDFDTDVFGVEQSIVKAVRSGELDLGWVGARAFSELDVHDFDALIAPMLIDSLATQRAVLGSDLPRQMLTGLEPLGVTGLAVIGGPLRRPIAADAPLVSIEDFARTPFYSMHGDVPAASIAGLGASNVDVAPPDRNAGIADGTIRAYENTLAYLSDTTDRRANVMTANINLWPAVGVLVANPASLASLSDDQRAAIETAASSAAGNWLDVMEDEDELAGSVCASGGRLALAEPDALGEFEAALRPVHRQLASDPVTAGYLEEIRALKGDTPPDAVSIPAGCDAS